MAALLRHTLGEVLRAERIQRGLTLRQVSSAARVSLGYISEIERGHKEASSELRGALRGAMDVRFSEVLHLTAERIAPAEPIPTVVVAAA